MAGEEGQELKGLSKYFNSVTITGRANVAKVTLGSMVLIGLYFTLKPKKSAAK